MCDIPGKINNSYESGSSSSSQSANDQTVTSLPNDQVFQPMQREDGKLTTLILPATDNLQNTSVEEGIFPNITSYKNVEVPSYQREYDYDFSETPLVYSWLPIVPGFAEDAYSNLRNFQHLHSLNISSSSTESKSPNVSNQNEKYENFLVIGTSCDKELHNRSCVEYHELENSGNAVDLNIFRPDVGLNDPDLSFNGKILDFKENETFSRKTESFQEGIRRDEEVQDQEHQPWDEGHVKTVQPTSYASLMLESMESALTKHSALTTTRPSLSLNELLIAYNKNICEPMQSVVTSNAYFAPTHSIEQMKALHWPCLLSVNVLGVTYNKNTDCEDLENLFGNYVESVVGVETSSSFNLRIGQTSAKKIVEKLKVIGQSPGRRLSHLANRRKIFSSANLKSASLMNTSQSSSSSGRFLIDKSKLYAKNFNVKKRTSAKKKTPGKKKTPKSAQRQQTESTFKQVSSKRALFTSPISQNDKLKRLPRRTLFSPVNDENKKRRRSISPEQNSCNRAEKQRRVVSPTRFPKSQSFSITSSKSTVNESFRKRLFNKTQSEIFPQPSESFLSSGAPVTLGYKGHLDEVVKQKILWSVSTALNSKNISNHHEKFKEYASILAKLVKKIFLEFHNPGKSVSGELMKFANHIAFYVVNGRASDEIYKNTKNLLQSKNVTKVIAEKTGQNEQNQRELNRKSDSFVLSSQSCSSLNYSQQSENSFGEDSMALGDISLSLNRSSCLQTNALRENFQSGEKPNRKFGSDSNLIKSTSASSSSLLKAKRQISF